LAIIFLANPESSRIFVRRQPPMFQLAEIMK
jgi:hypothetical protein